MNGVTFVASTTATRLWRVTKAAGRPFPVLDGDDVIDFQIAEAVALKVGKEDVEQEERKKQTDWKQDKAGIDRLRELSRGG